MRCIFMQERSVQSLIRLLYPLVWCIYTPECSVHLLIHLFPWVQCICTCKNIIYTRCTTYIPMSAMYLHARTFCTLSDMILCSLRASIFTVITEVYLRANRAVVTNNLTVIIEVVLIKVMLLEGFMYSSSNWYHSHTPNYYNFYFIHFLVRSIINKKKVSPFFSPLGRKCS